MQIEEISYHANIESWDDRDGSIILKCVCARCHARIHHDDVFCAKCGRKLRPIQCEIPLRRLIELLDGHRDELVCVETAEEEPEAETPPSKAEVIETQDSSTCLCAKSCPRCKTSPNGCEFLESTTRLCKGVCYPTHPPQYDPCVFLTSTNTKGVLA